MQGTDRYPKEQDPWRREEWKCEDMAWHKGWEFPVGLDSSPAWCGLSIILAMDQLLPWCGYYIREGILAYDKSYGLLSWDWCTTRNPGFIKRINSLQSPFQGLHLTYLSSQYYSYLATLSETTFEIFRIVLFVIHFDMKPSFAEPIHRPSHISLFG